jgi:hypothetical protein
LSADTKIVIIATEKEIKIATIFICVSINPEKINITFSELPILKNIAHNNATTAMNIGTRNFINTLLLEIK